MIQALSSDDLLWLIGQKEATLLLVTRQAQELIGENQKLNKEIEELKKSNTELPSEACQRE